MKKLLMVLALMTIGTSAMAEKVTLTWDANKESDLEGYELHWGAMSNTYTQMLDIKAGPNEVKTATVELLPEDGSTTYFAVLAYDRDGNKSGYSNELPYKVKDSTAPATPGGLRKSLEQIANVLQSIAGNGLTIRIVK